MSETSNPLADFVILMGHDGTIYRLPRVESEHHRISVQDLLASIDPSRLSESERDMLHVLLTSDGVEAQSRGATFFFVLMALLGIGEIVDASPSDGRQTGSTGGQGTVAVEQADTADRVIRAVGQSFRLGGVEYTVQGEVEAGSSLNINGQNRRARSGHRFIGVGLRINNQSQGEVVPRPDGVRLISRAFPHGVQILETTAAEPWLSAGESGFAVMYFEVPATFTGTATVVFPVQSGGFDVGLGGDIAPDAGAVSHRRIMVRTPLYIGLGARH
jgi:hypothetical protein